MYMFGLDKYKDLFGKPNTGLRKYRIFNIALYDVVVTTVIVYAITWYFSWPFPQTLALVFILGIFVHRIFDVRTGIDKLIFPKAS
jgi:fatty acid desaturase